MGRIERPEGNDLARIQVASELTLQCGSDHEDGGIRGHRLPVYQTADGGSREPSVSGQPGLGSECVAGRVSHDVHNSVEVTAGHEEELRVLPQPIPPAVARYKEDHGEAATLVGDSSPRSYHRDMPITYKRPATARAVRERVLSGLHASNIPAGYLPSNAGRAAMPGPKALLLREAILAMGKGNVSVRKLHARMSAKGLLTYHDTPYSLSAFHEMLTNPYYAGFVQIHGELYEGDHQPVVSGNELEACRCALAGRRRRRRPPTG